MAFTVLYHQRSPKPIWTQGEENWTPPLGRNVKVTVVGEDMRWDTLFGHSEEFSTHLVAYPMYNFTIPVGQELEHSLAEFSLLICEGLVLSIIRINGTNRGYQKELHEWFLLFSN